MISTVRKLTLKKLCANCVMLAGAITALTGAFKSVVEVIPPGCTSKPAVLISAPQEVRKLPVPRTTGPRTLESRTEPPIVFYRTEEPVNRWVVLIWPVVLGSGVAVLLAGWRMKKNARKVIEEVVRV